MLDLLLCLLYLLITKLYHILLLLYTLDCLFKLSLYLIEPTKLMLQLVFLLCDFLHLLHQSSILLLHLLNVSL